MDISLIYTKDKIYISKENKDWREWQDLLPEYKTSLSFNNLIDLKVFLESEYKISEVDYSYLQKTIGQSVDRLFTIDFQPSSNTPINIQKDTQILL